MKKGTIILVIGTINLCFSLGKLITSFGVETYDGGFTFDGSSEAIVGVITGILLILLGVSIHKEEKQA